MAKLESFYMKSMRGLWGEGYWVTWHPSITVRLGDIGRLTGGRFVPIQRLADLEIAFAVSDQQSPRDELLCGLDSGVDVDLSLRAQGVPAAARVDADAAARVSFTGRGAVFAVFRDLVESRIENVPRLAESLVNLYWTGTWNADQVAVTHLVTAGHAAVFGSTSRGGSVSLGAASGVYAAPVRIADLGAGFRVVNATGVELQLVSADLTPFFRVVRLRPKWLGGVEIEYGPTHSLRSARPAAVPAELVEEAREDPDTVLDWPDQVMEATTV